MVRLEALPAKHGDSLLLHFGSNQLIVIDGGPATVYKNVLKPRLDEIRKTRKLSATTPLDIELMMVSHIDADHITGLLELTRKIKELKDSKEPVLWRIKKCWHNSFDDTVATGMGAAVAGAAAGGADAFAADADVFAASMTLSPASVKQGRELAKLLPGVNLDGNPPFDGLVEYRQDATARTVALGDLTLTVIGPNEKNVELLRKDWARKVVEVIQKEKDKAKATAIVADYVDRSPYNLSSIVMLAECDGKSMLLTGDGRGDHTLDELDKAGLIKDGALKVDLLKLPHHGSSRNVDQDYFETIRAKHYVISADGKFSNPDVETLEMISKARPEDDFTIYLTYPFDEFHDLAVGKEVQKFFRAEHDSGRSYKVVTRAAGDPSISVSL
jgi:hypothetical protein